MDFIALRLVLQVPIHLFSTAFLLHELPSLLQLLLLSFLTILLPCLTPLSSLSLSLTFLPFLLTSCDVHVQDLVFIARLHQSHCVRLHAELCVCARMQHNKAVAAAKQ